MLAFNITVEKGLQEQLKSTSGPPVPEVFEFAAFDWAWITCLFSRSVDSFNKPESLTTIKVC